MQGVVGGGTFFPFTASMPADKNNRKRGAL